MLTATFAEQLRQIPDPRRQNDNLRHPLVNVLTIGFCGIICGCEGFTEMEEFGQAKKRFFDSFLTLPHGIPSHDTFGRVFAIVPPETLMQTLSTWLAAREESEDDKPSDRPAVHIDGKTMRSTGRGQALVHLVGAWASEQGLALGQVAVEQKSNEIEAIPHLLDLLDLKNTVVTIDAAGTQKSIAKAIHEQNADYVLALKRNHPTLYGEVSAYFLEATDSGDPKLRHIRRCESCHGREEVRDYYTLPVPKTLYERRQWRGLKSLGMVIRTWRDQKTGEEHMAVRYYLSSLEPGVKAFARYARSHWSIENSLHWVLDVAFREDECPIENPTAAANVSAMNRLALSALKSDTRIKRGIATKRKVAGWREDYLLEILAKALNL
jgi:predicted transposase YbfD/YdcC